MSAALRKPLAVWSLDRSDPEIHAYVYARDHQSVDVRFRCPSPRGGASLWVRAVGLAGAGPASDPGRSECVQAAVSFVAHAVEAAHHHTPDGLIAEYGALGAAYIRALAAAAAKWPAWPTLDAAFDLNTPWVTVAGDL